jgi:HAMP domain-containing protein
MMEVDVSASEVNVGALAAGWLLLLAVVAGWGVCALFMTFLLVGYISSLDSYAG